MKPKPFPHKRRHTDSSRARADAKARDPFAGVEAYQGCREWKRDLERCELCGQPVEPGTGRRIPGYPFIAWVCNRHPGELVQGEPIAPPRTRMLRGTSELAPQAEKLFYLPRYRNPGQGSVRAELQRDWAKQ